MSYKNVIEDFSKRCKEEIGESILSLYLRGGIVRGDFVPGYSDVDFYLVFKKEAFQNESILKKIKRQVKELCLNLGKSYNMEVSCYMASENEAKKACMETYLASLECNLLFGDDVLKNAPPYPLEKVKTEAWNVLAAWFKSVFAHPAKEPHEAQGATYMVLKMAQEALFLKGIIEFDKRKIVNRFMKEYSDFPQKETVEYAYYIRSNWQKIKDDKQELMTAVKRSVAFYHALQEYLTKKKATFF